MHTNPPMYNPMMPNYPDNMGDPSQSNFNISYGAPNYAMPSYGTPNDGYPNYGSGNYMDHKPQMNRDRSQEFMPRKDYYPSKNPGHFQRDPQYNRNRPMGNGRNGMNNNGNNFQRMPNRKPRENSSYRSNPMDNSYDDPKVLQQSRKITKPMMMRNPGRRQDGPGQRPMNYGDRQPYNSNYSKPSPREPRQDFDDSEEQKANSAMFFKTKLCPHQAEGGCTRGNSCNYAHSESELRNPPNLKKTKLCQLFQAGRCNRGNMCSFAHGEQELRSTPEFYKTSICNGYLKGSCRLGTACRYAHGKEELRTKHENAPSYSSTNMMPHGSDPDNSNGYDLNSYQTTEPSNVDVNKDAKNNRFVVNGNNMHNYINHQMPMDTNPVDPTYLNNSQGNNGFKSSPSSRNDNLSQNAYNPVNPKYNNYVPNNWDRNGPSTKTSNSQVEHPDNINFHPYNPEKINFTPNENSNFLK